MNKIGNCGLTIEKQIKNALTKNPITRDRLIIKILAPSVEKCISILLINNRNISRIYSLQDLIQEANLTILRVVRNSNFSNISCAIRTYMLGAVKRKMWGLFREEFAIKRQAQTKAYSLTVLEEKYLIDKVVNKNLKFKQGEQDVAAITESKDLINKIQIRLKSPVKEIFEDLISGYKIKAIAVRQNMPMQTVYTLIRRKIKPIAKKLMKVE